MEVKSANLNVARFCVLAVRSILYQLLQSNAWMATSSLGLPRWVNIAQISYHLVNTSLYETEAGTLIGKRNVIRRSDSLNRDIASTNFVGFTGASEAKLLKYVVLISDSSQACCDAGQWRPGFKDE